MNFTQSGIDLVKESQTDYISGAFIFQPHKE